MKRQAGILLPLSSLPSPYGIGTMGKAAYDWVDFLSDSGVSWWQILPLGPTSYGDSPYQPFSSAAGNPYFIDLDFLIADGLLEKDDVSTCFWGDNPSRVDYGAIYSSRFTVLEKAWRKGRERYRDEIALFEKENSSWLPDYALFMALKRHFGMKSWTEWDDKGARRRDGDTIAFYKEKLSDDISLFSFIQFLFFRQWNALRSYATEKGIGIIGDIPIYVALDSVDVWSEPSLFQLDDDFIPTAVSGVPPDGFSGDGQLWGNPLYRWDRMRDDGYSWWKKRIAHSSNLYSMLRFDHFRGLCSYYSIPGGEKTARNGEWIEGPGKPFIDTLNASFPSMRFNAEDLGYLTDEVRKLLNDSGWPGMKVLQFAYDYREDDNTDPSDYVENSVCYTGTHDNDTVKGWLEKAPEDVVRNAKERLGVTKADDVPYALIRKGVESRAFLIVVPLQDWLGEGSEARMNEPGTDSGNWQWRLSDQARLCGLEKVIRKEIGDRAAD